MLKFHPPSKMKDKPIVPQQTSPLTSTKPDGTVMNPAFQDIDGLGNQVSGSTYGSYQTLTNDNYPTRSVSTISPVSKGDYPPVGRANPGFLNDSTDTGAHVYPERDGHYATKSLPRPEIKTPSHVSRRSYSPTEDRELPTYYMPVNSHRKLLRGEILYVTKDTRNSGGKCWRRALCIGLIAAIVVVAIVIGSLSGTGILFNRTSPNEALQIAPSPAVTEVAIKTQRQGVDIEVHEVDASPAEVSPSRTKPAGVAIDREPKSDATLTEWRRQNPGRIPPDNLDAVSARPTVRPDTFSKAPLFVSPADQGAFNDGVPEAVEGELRIMNMDFQAALTDRSSWIFQYTANDLAVYFNEIFMKSANSVNYNATRIVSFRPGSVIVKYQALWNQAAENWDTTVLGILNRHLDVNNNFIGNYLVDRGSVTVKSIFYTCRVNNGGCSHLCEFDLLEMRHYCLCPDNTYSLLNLTTCVQHGAETATPIALRVASTTTQTTTTAPATTTTPVTTPTTTTPVTAPTTTTLVTVPTTATPVTVPTTTTLLTVPTTTTTVTVPSTTTAPTTTSHSTVPTTLSEHVGMLVIHSNTDHGPSSSSNVTVITVAGTNSSQVPVAGGILLHAAVTEQLPASSTAASWEAVPTSIALSSSSPAVLPGVLDVHATATPHEVTHQLASTTVESTTAMMVVVNVHNVTEAGIVHAGPAAVTTESHYVDVTVTPTAVISADHVNSTLVGHIPLSLGGSAVSHIGTTPEDDHDHHEEDLQTTLAPVHVETDFLITNNSHLDIISHPVAQGGEPALMTMRRTTTPVPVVGSLSCPDSQIACVAENRCVPAIARCNGVSECLDGSDESGCTDCQSNFKCRETGNCIPVGLVCDGTEDCSDGSDEHRCSQNFCQSAGMFHCVTGYCLENSSRCDGLGDCYAMGLPVDEMNCFNPQQAAMCFGSGHFFCSQSRRCIPMSWRCNGRTDCLNSEDEQSCTCNPATTFACDGGGCVANQARCDGIVDCPDGYSDERDCVRLQTTGIVEVRHSEDQWRTVCSDNWNMRSADSVCRQMGYRPALQITSWQSEGNSTAVYRLDHEANSELPLQNQLRAAVSGDCLDNSTRAGVMCERFLCQALADPGVGSPSKLLSAVVKISFEGDAYSVCNGYLVAPMWILTAASCLANRNASVMKLSFFMDAFHARVSVVNVHPLYLPVRMLHDRDFALLKLTNTVPSNFLPICLPSNVSPILCKLVKLYTNNTLTSSVIERLNTSDCNAKSNYAGLVSGSMDCVTSSQSMCDDDAVSPQVCQTLLGNWELRSLLSYQHHCGFFTKKPFVMANITYASAWIRSVVGPSLDNVIQTTEPAVFVPYPDAVSSHTTLTQTDSQVKEHSDRQSTTQTAVLASHVIVVPDAPVSVAAVDHTLHGDADSLAELHIVDILLSNLSTSFALVNITTENMTLDNNNTSSALMSGPTFNVSVALVAPQLSASVTETTMVMAVSSGLTCPDGTSLLQDFLCDEIFQCADGWDEKLENCLNASCNLPTHQRCANGRCIDAVGRCDGRSQCPVISTDEVGCKDCDKTSHFQCHESRCIPLSWMCDGENDCMDGEDETNDLCTGCSNLTDSFHCTFGGGCIASTKVCDGLADCPDSSDEATCIRFVWSNDTSTANVGIVEIRAQGSSWASICRWNLGDKQAQWTEAICRELGFDSAVTSGPVVLLDTSTFVVDSEASFDSNVYMARKNMTTRCNNSEVIAASCSFNARGDWNTNVTNLDLAKAYIVAPDEYRHIVLLIHIKGGQEPCIGTILSSRWIITSHECISEADSTLSPFDWIVSTDPDSIDDKSIRFIRRFVAHPSTKFSVYFARHDLVLVELMDGVDLTAGRSKAAWPAKHPMAVKSTCVTYGWLYQISEIPGTRVAKKSQGQLYSWRTPLMMNEQCNQASNYNGLVDGTMFCAGFRNATHRSPCMGRVDGAPVMCLTGEGQWQIAGVRSYQPSCDSSWSAPAVYTDLYQHRMWIGQIVGNYLTKPI